MSYVLKLNNLNGHEDGRLSLIGAWAAIGYTVCHGTYPKETETGGIEGRHVTAGVTF